MSIYYSKVDRWLIGVIIGSVLFCIVLGLLIYNQSRIGSYICFGSGLFTGGVFLLFAFPCKYTLAEDRVIIQSGILRQEVLYSQITGVKKSNNPLSAPALSIHRVKITTTKGFKLISPENRDKFIEELKSKLIVAP